MLHISVKFKFDFSRRQNLTPIVTSLKRMGCRPNKRDIPVRISPPLIIEGGMPLGFLTDNHGGSCQALYYPALSCRRQMLKWWFAPFHGQHRLTSTSSWQRKIRLTLGNWRQISSLSSQQQHATHIISPRYSMLCGYGSTSRRRLRIERCRCKCVV